MSFSYNLEDSIGKVRLKIQDTDPASAHFSDEEIDYFLAEEVSVNCAAAAALEAMAASLSGQKTEESIEGYSYKRDPAKLLEMAKQLRAKDEDCPYFAILGAI